MEAGEGSSKKKWDTIFKVERSETYIGNLFMIIHEN